MILRRVFAPTSGTLAVCLVAGAWYLAVPGIALADCDDELAQVIGYTVVGTKTIEGYRDPDGSHEDSFEGCEHDRVIRFTDGTRLTCTGYSYSYSYMPTAVLFAKAVTYQGKTVYLYKMLVEDEIYDMRR